MHRKKGWHNLRGARVIVGVIERVESIKESEPLYFMLQSLLCILNQSRGRVVIASVFVTIGTTSILLWNASGRYASVREFEIKAMYCSSQKSGLKASRKGQARIKPEGVISAKWRGIRT